MLRRTALKPRKRYKPVSAERHHDYVASLGCLVCGADAEVHHVTGYADKPGRFSRDHWLTVPLCPFHHRIDRDASNPTSVQGLTHQGFYETYGIDLLAEAMKLADYSREAA